MSKLLSFFSHKYSFILLVGVLFFSVFGYSIYTAHSYLTYQNQQTQIKNMISLLKEYDGTLTYTAIIYALSNDETYLDTYLQTAPLLNDLIQEAMDMFPEINNQLLNLNDVNTHLYDLEKEAFALVQNGQAEEAIEIFKHPSYVNYKTQYANELSLITSFLRQAAISFQQRFISIFIISFLIFFLVFIALLVALVRVNHLISRQYKYQKYIGEIAECLITDTNESLDTNLICFLNIVAELFEADVTFVSMIKSNRILKHWIKDHDKYSMQLNRDLCKLIKETNNDHQIIHINHEAIQPDQKAFMVKHDLKDLIVCVSSYNTKMVFFGFANHAKELKITAIHHHLLTSILGLLKQAYNKMNYEDELFYLATTDSLTKIDNRRMLIEKGEKERRRHLRYNLSGSLLMIDLDLFKNINDTYGHSVGDMVLKHFAETTKHCLRDIDSFGRMGGEEFLVLLPNTSLDDAQLVARRIQAALANNPFKYQSKTIPYTVSIGITQFNQDDNQLDDALNRSDQAMYLAKEKGRNRIEIITSLNQ
jgi:diguanylate cyclase (GGDEF)-like protein